jgi:REP element-mobilizing transposase RayT
VNRLFCYVLAVAAERYGLLVHAFCVLSNHYHLVVTDPRARLPEFQRYLDGLVARATNCCLGRWESFWDPDSYSAVRLESATDVLDKIVYVLANPVAAGLVRHGSEWPGPLV